jgi:hypothetical protein
MTINIKSFMIFRMHKWKKVKNKIVSTGSSHYFTIIRKGKMYHFVAVLKLDFEEHVMSLASSRDQETVRNYLDHAFEVLNSLESQNLL